MQKTAFDSGTALAFFNCPPERYRGLTKTLLVMKLTILFTAIAFFQVQASTLAQTVTLSGKDFTLKQVFAAIDKQTGYALMTNKGTLDASKPVTLTVHKMPLREFLDFVLKEEELEYEIEGKTIFLSKKNKVVSGGAPPERLEVYKDQEIITGQVINEDGAGLSGVSIFHKKMNKGTLTDAQGLFSIKAKKGDTLLFSIVGYADQQVKITGNILQVRMKVAHSVLDETQVTAYGKTSRRLSTGNISTVKGEDIQRQPVMTVQEALIGRVAGLTIERTSGNSAAPVKVRIRGTNTINQNAVADPLYVIDGIPVNMMNTGLRANSPVNMGAVQAGVVNTIGENPLLFLNPADIERVDVLKDADATAIYGSRGANGVILITTKRSKGGPTTVGVTVQKDVRFNQNYPRLLNTPEYLAVRREAFRNDGIEPAIGNAPDLTLWDSTKYTDWQRMLVGKGGATTVNVNVGGGEGQTRYSLSGGYSTLKDIMNNGGKNERISFNSSVSHRSRDSRFNFTLGNMISHTEVNSYAISSLGRLPPNAPDMYNNKGEFNFDGYRIGNTTFFPFAGIRQPSSSKTLSVNNQIQLDYELINGLNLSMTARYAFNTNDNINLKPSASIDPLSWALPMAFYGLSKGKTFAANPSIQYRTTLGKGNLSVQLIGNYESTTAGGETITGMGYANDGLMKSHNNADPLFKTVIQSLNQYKYAALSAIVNYNWANKYVINLNGNRDGCSRFGPGRQFGNFGSAGATWIASEEEWMKKLLPSWFSLVKFSGSYGITGSQSIGDYEYLSRWASTTGVNTFASQPRYNGLNVFHPLRALNQDYQWESTTKTDFSVWLGFMNDRLNVRVSTYRNVTGNQLARVPTPEYTGFTDVVRNWDAKLANMGIEMSLLWNVLSGKDYGLNVSFNISRNRNRLLDFPNLETSSYKNNLKIGNSTNIVYLLRYTGIDPATGSYTFEDLNKDGKITAGSELIPNQPGDDRQVFIDLNEKYNGNLGIQFRYKSLSCNTNIYFVNRLRKNPYLVSAVGTRGNIVLPKEIADNHWQYPGHQAKYPRYTNNSSLLGPIEKSDGGFVNGSYMRMQNLSLGYSLPVKWCKKIGAKEVSFTLSLQNLFTISPYTGLDPELEASIFAAPIARTVSTGLRVNF